MRLVGNSNASELLLQKAAEAVRAVDPAAFPVPARVVRRVIRSERDFSRFGMQVPHRKSFVINADELLLLVERDELGIDRASQVPSPAILIAQPGDDKLAGLTLNHLLTRYWKLLFHARIDATLGAKIDTGELTPSIIRERIDQIGQVEFDEMHAVIEAEDFLLPPEGFSSAYIEAAAVYLQLRYFEPRRLESFFPALEDYTRIDTVFSQDMDVLYLLETTRPQGAPAPEGLRKNDEEPPQSKSKKEKRKDKSPVQEEVGVAETADSKAEYLDKGSPNQKLFDRLIQKANRVSEQGNSVRAALMRLRAAKHAPEGQSGETSIAAMGELEQLSRRLQAALGLDDEEADGWRDVMVSLLAKSTEGFWSADKRLLYDLQKVCIDHEREISHIDLVGWAISLGKQPIRRLLPNQREVRINKHLRQATSRLTSIRLSGPEREQLSELLHHAAHQVEIQLRERLRPLVAEALNEVGFEPNNLPERVSRRKIIEELLDKIAHHGFVNMSMLRDAISRNNLKMPDLMSPQSVLKGPGFKPMVVSFALMLVFVTLGSMICLRESPLNISLALPIDFQFWISVPPPAGYLLMGLGVLILLLTYLSFQQDWLLQADRQLSKSLDGVYRRGEFYLRWLQKFSSLAFGTPAGRFATIYVAVPFGGAMIVLEGLKYLFDKLHGVKHEPGAEATEQITHLMSWFDVEHHTGPFILGIVVVGTFLCGMIHVRSFRLAVFELAKSTYLSVRRLLYDLPRWFWKHEFLRKVFRSRPMRWFRRHVLYPLVFTALFGLLLPQMGLYGRPEMFWLGVMFLSFAVLLNSRAGRDIEELTSERLYQTWDHIRVKWVIALIETTMNFFKRVMEAFERGMYAIDELLRFRSGQNIFVLVLKASLGAVWSVVALTLRVFVTVFFEPQVNPIKHFPIVTVSHKFMLPLTGTIQSALLTMNPSLDDPTAWSLAVAIVTCTPGIFGFLVWEFKENWKLYAANRNARLKPVLVGSHGETVIRLMKPGFHSGTIPKIFKKLRRIDRSRRPNRRKRLQARYDEKLHHTLVDIRHFVERELLVLLEESHQFGEKKIRIQNVQVASNSIRVALECDEFSSEPLVLAFQEQSAWLMVGVLRAGWLNELNDGQRQTLELAIAGFYKLAGVDIVREQLRGCFAPALPPYDVMEKGLVVWPDGQYQAEVYYDLHARPWMRPRPRSLARQYDLPTLEANHALYAELAISWETWVTCWNVEESTSPMTEMFAHEVNLLPSKTLAPSKETG